MRIGRWPFVACAIALALTACSSSTKTAAPASTTARVSTTTGPAEIGEPATATTATTAPAAATACTPHASYTPGTSTHHITVGGVDREFNVHLPPHPSAGMPLVVNLHGAASNMQEQEIYSGFDAPADRDGFVVAYPNGVDAAIRQWNFLKTPDIDFNRDVVQTLVRDACVDAARVYAVGISSGGAMSAALACSASDTFAGFGPVAGDFFIPALCDRAQQRPIIIFHGTADAIVPYEGGSVANSRGVPVPSEEKTAAAWAQHNGCTSGPTSTELGSEVTRLSWSGCVAPVVLYRIEGGGHTWPGTPIDVPRLGKTTKQISATDEMWKFFAAH